MISRWIIVSLILAGTVGCVVDIGAPPKGPRIRVVSDIARTDTIDAEPSARMVIEVSESGARLTHSVTVIIGGLQFPAGIPGLQMVPIDTSRTRFFTITETTTDGNVPFFVKFGRRAGRAGIIVTVPDLQFRDTLWFTVLPGAPAQIAVKPSDTALVVGASYTQAADVLDRGGNPLNLKPLFASSDAALTVSPTGIVQANAIARARVDVSYAAPIGILRDTAMVSVVPDGRIAQGIATGGTSVTSAIGLRRLDGSLIKSFPTPHSPFQTAWSSDGLRIYYVGGSTNPNVATTWRLFALTVADGTIREIVPDSVSALSGELLDWPAPSHDDTWLYFSAIQPGTGTSIWRIHLDGSGAQQIVPATRSPHSPSPSPDGNRLAYVEGNDVKVLELVTGSVVTIPGTGADEVRWSPTGDRLATKGGAGIYVVNPDGSGIRQVVPGNPYWRGLEWSPDGRWIVARIDGVPSIIDWNTGLVLPTPLFGAGLGWAPK